MSTTSNPMFSTRRSMMKQRGILWLFVVLCVSIPRAVVGATDEAPSRRPAELNFDPGPEYADSVRMFQGIPGIERAVNGRLWVVWYGGGVTEDRHNYLMLVTSDDNGNHWSPLKMVIDPDRDGPVRVFDPCLWHDPQGRLWLFWAQGGGEPHAPTSVWAICTENSDSPHPTWSAPRRLFVGVMLNKPTVLSSGQWLLQVTRYKQEGSSSVVVSDDRGATFRQLGGANVPNPEDRGCDEHMIVERNDGSLWMLNRTRFGIGQSVSTDQGKTWTDVVPANLTKAIARFFIRRLKSGNLLLVKNDAPEDRELGFYGAHANRTRLTAYLSDDDGKTWTGGLVIDDRKPVSYPDGVEGPDGTIYLVYDYSRYDEKQILMATFMEKDVLAKKPVSNRARFRVVVNQATGQRPKTK